jgi:8-amino-3,8-dideoxy-alpha-D-manno-octulosonate transaminase
MTHSFLRLHTSQSRRRFLADGAKAVTAGLLLHDRIAFADPASAAVSIHPGLVATQYYDEQEKNALIDVLETGTPFRYWGDGEPNKVKRFEELFAQRMGVPFALGVTSGTAALNCAIAGLDIGPGDEVIVPAYSWWSDYTCVINAGALPVFADIDETFNLDPEDFARRITPRTKAVIAVHLLGGPCDMDPIMEIAREHKIAVLEDCAQCVGGSYKGKPLGSIGDVGIYSFQVNKMISSGEGGAVVTGNPYIYERASRFHDMGIMREVFERRIGNARLEMFPGENYRMNEFTGAVLFAQVTKLDTMIQDQRRNAGQIWNGIKDLPGLKGRKQPDPAGDIGYSVYFRVKDRETRDRCIGALDKRGVPAATLTGSVLLPIEDSVINKHTRHPNWPSFSSAEGKAMEYGPDCCRQTLEVFDRFVQLRVGPKYTEEQNQQIVSAVRDVYSGIS